MINNGSFRQRTDNHRARRERNCFAQRGGSGVVRQDHLKDQRIGSRRKAMADAKLDAHRIGLIVDDREECLLLPGERLEVAQLAVICVVLKRDCPTFGKVIGHSSCWREIQRA